MENKNPQNPSAFPCINADYDNNWNKQRYTGGMTLRDYFAAKVMQSLIGKENLTGGKEEYTIISRHAYCCADEMLKEREL